MSQTLCREWDFEPKHRGIVNMEAELKELRRAVFDSNEWCQWCKNDAARLRKAGGKTQEEIERSVFARVAQSLENDILTSMRSFLNETGWKERALIFDGLIVEQRPGLLIDYDAMSARIKRETGFDMEVCEKPFHDGPAGKWPEVSLMRLS